jgi:hypothetical protein
MGYTLPHPSHSNAPRSFVCGINRCRMLIEEDADTQSYIQHITTAHAGLPILSSPSVRCQMDTCNDVVLPVERDNSCLIFHLMYEHEYLTTEEDTSCRWWDYGLTSASASTSRHRLTTPSLHHAQDPQRADLRAIQRCPWRGGDHQILSHVISSHLNFVDLCSRCGYGPFSRKSSRDRHESGCQGRVPARCRDCLREFPSIVALGGHAELGLCRPMP